jgi:hypothetical protein
MAIRDHVRMEVLIPKAADLQRADAELGQLERIIESGSSNVGGECPACRAMYARGAAFCAQCAQPLARAMIARLHSVRLTWPQIALIAAASAFATAVVIHAGARRDGLPYRTLSALRRGVVVHGITPRSAAPRAVQAAPASTPSAAAANVSPVSSSLTDEGGTTLSGTTVDTRTASPAVRPAWVLPRPCRPPGPHRPLLRAPRVRSSMCS